MTAAAVLRARELLRAKNRREEGAFLAEGPHVVGDALAERAVVRAVFASHESAARPEIVDLLRRAEEAGAAAYVVTGRELLSICDTDTPQGIVAVVATPEPPSAPFQAPGLWLVLDEIQDPGNVGTLLRAAEAFGARGALATPGTADLFSGKVVRSAQGAHFRLALLAATSDRLDELHAAGGELWAAAAGGESVYAAPPPPPRCALVLGNEVRGVSDALAARASRTVGVPQRGRADSLNVAMAGSVLLSWMSERRGGGTS
jgi:RNA methyltransferase, TrmH family